MPEKEITIEELWKMVNTGVEKMKEKDSRLRITEKKIADIKEALRGLSTSPKLSDFIAFVSELRELVK